MLRGERVSLTTEPRQLMKTGAAWGPWEVAWSAAVLASLVMPREAEGTRWPAVVAAGGLAAAWMLVAGVVSGSVRVPGPVMSRARRPLSTRSLLLLGAAVGPAISFFVLACLRVIALDPEERRRVIG